MVALPRFATVVAGTASIISVQLFGFFNPASPVKYAKDLGVLTSVFANLPANAELNSSDVLLSDNNFLVSQETSPPAISSQVSYVPPAKTNTRQSQGSGSRGCDQSLPVDLVTLLIPSKEYVGQTTSGHPTFFWHLSQPVSVPIEFSLVEPGVTKPLLVQPIDASEAGVIQVEFPKDRPELQPGKVYGWSVTLVCNPRRPSANPYYYSWIERVPTSPTLEEQLRTATSETPQQQALIYAQAGSWYDALAAISTAQAANPNDPSVQKDFFSLLDQVGLSNVVEQERQRLGTQES